MSFNNYENSFLAYAIAQLEPRYRAVYGDSPKPFYLGCGITFVLIKEGPDKNKLAVGLNVDGELVPDPSIKPADCYNLWPEGCRDLATAVRQFETSLKSSNNGRLE